MGHNFEGILASDAGCADATLRAPARHPSGARQRSLSGGSPEAARAARSVPGASLAPVSGRPSLPPSPVLASGGSDRDAAELDGPTTPLDSRARLAASAAGLLLGTLFIALAAVGGLLVAAVCFGHPVGGIG